MAKDGVATKSDLKKLERVLGSDIKGLERALRPEIKSLETRIVNSEVKILGELKDMREDFSAHQFSHRRINDELQDHEKQISKLESTQV